MGWNPWREIRRVVGDVGDFLENTVGELDFGDVFGGVTNLFTDAEWAGIRPYVMGAAEIAAALATGGTSAAVFAGLDLIGVSDEVLAAAGLTPEQIAQAQAERERQRQAYLLQLQQGGGGGSGGGSDNGMLWLAAGAVGLVLLSKK